MDFLENIHALAEENTNFRSVVATNKHSQVVVMSLLPGEDIGMEVHEVDQMIVIVSGTGHAAVDGKKRSLVPGDLVIVPAGTQHNILNDPLEAMKLYTVYAPAEHPDGTVHRTKAEAEAAEAAEH